MKIQNIFTLGACAWLAVSAIVGCSDDQANKPASVAEAVGIAASNPLGQAVQAAIDHPEVQAATVPAVVDCAAPAKAVDGVCLHPVLTKVNGRSDDCGNVKGCPETFFAWENTVNAKFHLFQ
jgi:hypothetical protein